MDKIKILKVEPGKPPCVKEIANDFKASQVEVEGDIECVGFGDGCVAVIDVYKRQQQDTLTGCRCRWQRRGSFY